MKKNDECFGNDGQSRNLVEGAGFHIEKCLESSSGDVFLARSLNADKKPNDLVVVKRFHGSKDKCFEAKEMFLWKDCLQNIARILNVVSLDVDTIIVSEFVGGGDLYNHFQEIGVFPEFLAHIFMHDLCTGVSQLHRAGISHRDLKPENCVLDTNGVLKIIDFGIAARFDESTWFTDYCGSIEYASPEIMLRRPYRGPDVDVWACGVVLFEMVVGEVPFAIVEGKSPSCGVFNFPVYLVAEAELSIECEDLLKKVLCVDPENRLKLSAAFDSNWMVEKHILTVDDISLVQDQAPKSVVVKRLLEILRGQLEQDMLEATIEDKRV